ncbi:hypothetical protein LTR56_010218 [Elasticomyces elasticus]|nr:hypothetical protein LTR22_017232 [Elasticomyces elasticus]KAK3643480.1 hypothetical protein LTR56_010218 [Elasticomyces elasticus]KAK4925312.1 hypothetical protein LTR49_007610 [Elasticomyces elasticus]KAK5761317.1 hypothetical protein LTS12_008593 [Elasticomyces elasticus]
MAGLNGLPSELIANIFTFLNDADVFATRQTCHAIERASIAHFGHRFFRKIGFMITTPSLNTLTSISNHKDLQKYIQHLWFNPDCFTFIRPDCAPDPQDEPPNPSEPDSILQLLSPSDRKSYTAYQTVKRDHSRLLHACGKELQQVLTVIFATLPNLKIIGMRRSEDHAPWGWKALKHAVGQDPRELGPPPSGPSNSLSAPTKLFLAIINSVAATDIKLRRFYTDAIEIDNVRPELLTQDTLNKACGSIWYLELNVSRAWLMQRSATNPYSRVTDEENYGEGLVKLLKATTELREIGLQIFPSLQQGYKPEMRARGKLETWRKSMEYLCMRNVVLNVQLLNLTRVKLEKLITSPDMLVQFLQPSAENLTSLKLQDIRLLSDDDNPKPWRTFFAFLLDYCPKLDFLLFYHLLYDGGGVYFVKGAPESQPVDPDTLGRIAQDNGAFRPYEHITLQVSGREEVKVKLGEVVEGHYYDQAGYSYELDEGEWHTDTSDEEW